MVQSTTVNTLDIYDLIQNNQLTTKVLDKPKEVLEAKALLYKVYIEEGKWSFPKNNLSGIRVAYHNDTPYLEDNFASVSTWLGLYLNDKLIICIRVMNRLNKKFEVEHYQVIPSYLKQDPLVEANRLAVHASFRGTILSTIFTESLLEYCISINTSILATAPIPGIGYYYMRIAGFKKVDILPFKYNKSEKQSVSLLHLDIPSARHKLQSLKNAIQKTLQTMTSI